jgi:hypothetical protein
VYSAETADGIQEIKAANIILATGAQDLRTIQWFLAGASSRNT